MPESLPSHFAQNMNVAAEPNASKMMRTTCFVSTNETSVAHFAISMPNGAMNMHMMPSIIKRAKRGMRSNSRSMSSMSRLPMWCSAVPTHRNSKDLAAAWNMTSNIAAQMPFHTWLLGAMVAPTPTSAMLHSSTMVKAGVFLLIKLAPLFLVCQVPGTMVILIGGITFMLCSFMAISQTNAKRVLAYSTIANLGLITACAGVGTPEAIWAAILLVIFHAAAKSLLFLCVGTAEHHIGSRDIEDMDLLFERMPRLARFMMLGIMCMFIAPFGMLIAKWATLVSFVETKQVVLIILLAFGSAATFMFWAKWLGKLSGIAGKPQNVEMTVHPSEWISLIVMAAIAIVACIVLPIMSHTMVEPYLVGIYGQLGQDISVDNLWISSILAVFVLVVLFGGVNSSKKKRVGVYLAGVSTDSDTRTYRNSLSGESIATSRNLYLDSIFGEARIRRTGEIVCAIVIIFALVASGVVPPMFY